MLTDISARRLGQARKALSPGAQVATHRADVTQRAEALAVVAAGQQALGDIDVLVNVVGGEGGRADCAAAKAAVAAFTRSLAEELAPQVNVNCVAPGLIQTSVTERLPQTESAELTRRSFHRRADPPEEVPDVVVFPASDEARFLTGEIIAVSGGHHPHL